MLSFWTAFDCNTVGLLRCQRRATINGFVGNPHVLRLVYTYYRLYRHLLCPKIRLSFNNYYEIESNFMIYIVFQREMTSSTDPFITWF